jgi:hypothetical protein
MQQNWDELDRRMLLGIVKQPGGSIRDVIRPFLKERSETALRLRVRSYWLHDLIEMKPGVTKVQCYPLLKNIKKIEGMLDTLGGVQV